MSSDTQTILIADDSRFFREMLTFACKEEGYECVTAESGSTAIAALAGDGPIDLILLDLMMPDVSGFAVLESLRDMKPRQSVPVIVVSHYGLNAVERGILQANRVVAMLPKSISLDRLLFELRQALHPELKENRRAPRTTSSLSVIVKRGMNSMQSTAFNLSEVGMFLVSSEKEPPQPGDEVTLKFWVPGDSELVEQEARVVWVNGLDDVRRSHPAGFAVEFVDPDKETLASLRGFVATQAISE